MQRSGTLLLADARPDAGRRAGRRGGRTGLLMPISTSNCCRMPAAFSLRAVRSRSMRLVSMPPVAISTAAFDSATSCLICSRNLSAVDGDAVGLQLDDRVGRPLHHLAFWRSLSALWLVSIFALSLALSDVHRHLRALVRLLRRGELLVGAREVHGGPAAAGSRPPRPGCGPRPTRRAAPPEWSRSGCGPGAASSSRSSSSRMTVARVATSTEFSFGIVMRISSIASCEHHLRVLAHRDEEAHPRPEQCDSTWRTFASPLSLGRGSVAP